MEMILELLKGVLETYAASFPAWLVSILVIIGSLRVLIKPIMSLFLAVTEFTHWTVKDDELYKKVVDSKIYKSIAYVLDYIASIKLPKSKK